MNIEVLVSTMNQINKKDVINKLKIKNCIIINQITKKIIHEKNDDKSNQKFYSFNEKGLSKSRNKATKYSTSDICVIADDDMYYCDNYENIIIEEYKKNKEADIIAFVVEHENKKKQKKIMKKSKIGFLKSMKLQSVQVTFRRKSILDNEIQFDENFGAGSIYDWGEENIFLFDCLRKGLNIYYVPIQIATLIDTGSSTWDHENTIEHYEKQGAIYYRMSKLFYWVLILQFAIRKKSIYKKDLTTIKVINSMFNGVKKYQRSQNEKNILDR